MMIEKDDWRLLNDVEHLYNKEIVPTDGEEIFHHMLELKKCIFCLNPVENTRHSFWYLPINKSCCICEECYEDFKDMFHWKLLDGWDIEWSNEKV